MLRATAIFILILVFLAQNYLGTPGPIGGPATESVTAAEAQQAAERLAAAKIPARDLYDLTARLKLHSSAPIPRTVRTEPLNRQVGDQDTFNVANIIGKSYYTETATVRFVTTHAYWYVANGYNVDMAALEASTQVFEQTIYPNNHQYFGTEWSPGIDADTHITILLADIKDVGGYYSSSDEYPTDVNPYSNEREMIYIASEPTNFPGPLNYFEGTLAHELQHMIHWNTHKDRDLWLDEGCAETAMRLSDYDVGGSDRAFLSDPNVQLTTWDETPNASIPHYGAAYLFVGYLMQHYGQAQILKALLQSPGTGVDAVNGALERTGHSERFDDVFKDWVVANYINDASVADGRYQYDIGDRVQLEKRLVRYPDSNTSTVHQYAAQYIGLERGQGDTVVTFDGVPRTALLNTQPHSGHTFWFSNRRDTADMTLTRAFDLTGQSKATLDYWTWFNIEGDFDYGYVEVSADGGKTWTLLKTKYSTDSDPNGANFGHGYTGHSGHEVKSTADPLWVHEQVDLSAYAGRAIQVRFEYVTDEGFNAPSWAIDDISIPEMGYSTDAETDDGGWQAAGFARVANAVPQHWYVAAVEHTSSGITVQELTVDADGHGTLEIPALGSRVSRAVIVVAALAPTTTESAPYKISVRKKQ